MILSNMGEDEPCFATTLKFPFLPPPAATIPSPEHPSGSATPPLQTLASVPFKWEELPGKPRPCTDIVLRSQPPKCLELPPCRMLFEPATRFTKMPSPTTVLDGPYSVGRSRFSSFRLFREARASFDSSSSGGGSPQSSVDVLLGRKKKGSLFGKSLRLKSGEKGADGGSFGFSNSSITGCHSVERCSSVKMTRNGSFVTRSSQTASAHSSQTASTHLWVTMRESLKKAIPWKSTRKLKKGLL